MKVIKVKDYEEASQKALEIMLDIVQNKPNANLGLATGSTPKRLYELMIEDHKINGTTYKNIKTFNLDEYYGLSQDHPQSYYYFMYNNLFKGLDINMDNVHVPRGSGNIDEECQSYNQLLKENTLDIQLLGIGSNGHIGFNEPGTPFNSTTHKVDLKESTIKDNAKLFFNGNEDEVPKQAVSMGIANIMEAKKVLLIACGEKKAQAIQATIEGKQTTEVPASVLQNHPNCIMIIDEEAAKLLETH